ncbi:hypothetical protein JMJ35_006578 [Cladonia borealis]|uniref:Beta-lactamase-related domain-containing protein n=1 Tax=Cladonia borealis TaxID=184061 RepID=A0AA39R066_9LECA|nr:hypothetical protein JMJ35_006578 [Cladonia borealis]
MADLVDRLTALGPKIEKLMEIGGAAGLSLGVVHHGEPIYQANFGFRDLQQALAPTEETIFPGCSLVKALTAATVALLVEDKLITWDTLIKDVLPEFNIKDDILRSCTTIADLLCHRTGMAWGDNLYVGTNNNILISGENSMEYINSQELLLPLRGQYAYNNIPYELAGHVIEKLTGSTWSEVLRARILDPIGLDRTSLKTPLPDIDNVAKCYNTLNDGTPTPVRCATTGDDGFCGPSGGLRTCVKDLLKFCSCFLKSANDQFSNAKIPMGDPTFRETSYAFGWARVQLPGPMGALVLEALLDVPERNDYIKAAESSVAGNAKWFFTTIEELEKDQKKGPVPRNLEEYTGTYWDASHAFKINVFVEEGILHWALQGLESEKWPLDHYEQDTFTWIRPRNELTKRGRWVDQGAAFWKIEFKADKDGQIDYLMWVHDIGVPPVAYLKEKGFNVYGTYRKESIDEAKDLLESGAKTLNLNLADETPIRDASESFGNQPLDILINCAGKSEKVCQQVSPCLIGTLTAGNGLPAWVDTTVDDFMQRFRVSAVGLFLTTRAFYSQLKNVANPLIINISSNAGSISGNEAGGNLCYRTSKAALNMITMDLARELAPDKISFTAMSPG